MVENSSFAFIFGISLRFFTSFLFFSAKFVGLLLINFSTKELTKSIPRKTPEMMQNEVKNLKPIKKIEPKTNFSTKISNGENYDDSSKNLADFFNGEIIDLDELVKLQYEEFFARVSF